MLNLRQSGDTIVEVLIAMAIVSAILGAAFVTVNRTQNATRASQERAQALRLAETQVELLKLGTSSTPPVVIPANTFCLGPNSGVPAMYNATSPTQGSPQTVSADDFSKYTSNCTLDSAGNTGAPGGNHYYIAIEQLTPTPSKLFRVHVRWDAPGGTTRDEVTLIYRTIN